MKILVKKEVALFKTCTVQLLTFFPSRQIHDVGLKDRNNITTLLQTNSLTPDKTALTLR